MSGEDLSDFTQAIIKFLCYLGKIAIDAYVCTKFALKNLCVAWYPLAILTLIPVLQVEIKGYYSIAYLLTYCAFAAWVCVWKPKPSKKTSKAAQAGFMENVKIETTRI